MDDNLTNTFAKVLCLKSVKGISNSAILRLVGHFGSLDNLFNTTSAELSSQLSIKQENSLRIVEAFNSLPKFEIKAESEINKLKKVGGNIMSYWSQDYPPLLKNINASPIILFTLGDTKILSSNTIAIVGTRRPTDYGKHQAYIFAKELSSKGLTIVSGLARGIDSISHRAALNAGGTTVAVLGSGLDVIYPPENRDLFNKIASDGVVITEYSLGTKPDAYNFPSRNRIISGLSLGTLVVESRIKGGSLQTAQFALEQNREVFAIPGNIGIKDYEGTNNLIKNGEAKLIQSTNDILCELNLNEKKPKIQKNHADVPLSIFEQKVFDTISNKAIHIDDISIKTGLSTTECLIQLLSLEFKGVILQLPGKFFIKN